MPNKTIVAMIAITAILITALIKGIDGVITSSGIAVLAGLGGFVYGKFKK